MKIRLLSDLHHEHFDGRRQLPEVEADVVVLAGDIHSHLEGLHWARETFADSEIVYVAGNHEFYSSEMTDLTQAMRNISRALEIHFLENDEARIGPARFLGATLWTDFQLYGADGYAPAHELALQSMPDFSCIDWFGGDFTPEQSIALHRASRDWLAEQLARPHDGPTLVVSHHAPSALSIPPQFVGNPLSPAFASNLDELVAQADYWLHGHVHDALDYRIGRARVLANPGGYPHEKGGFRPEFVFEI
ncbi:metallo-dependent phosphatase [Pseudomonas aeruginosa]|nr:metallo-dependent phosphatase [Pseudomonas aeruginosa]MCO2259235.1 metallo-dependent phosphatase [Pseudomonas aeruginosa]MCO3073956.1 metallo-dependent phosphatase [Pseudomonas aeruginosa]